MQILKSTKVLFSRLWHVGERSEEQPLWILATQLGAKCTTQLDNSVTHVVTNTLLTEKVDGLNLLNCRNISSFSQR